MESPWRAQYIGVLCDTHTPVYGPSTTTQVSWCQKRNSSGLYGATKDKQTIRQGATASGLISDRPPSLRHFYARCPSCRNPPTLAWLLIGIKYAGLHTQWRGFGALRYKIDIRVYGETSGIKQ